MPRSALKVAGSALNVAGSAPKQPEMDRNDWKCHQHGPKTPGSALKVAGSALKVARSALNMAGSAPK